MYVLSGRLVKKYEPDHTTPSGLQNSDDSGTGTEAALGCAIQVDYRRLLPYLKKNSWQIFNSGIVYLILTSKQAHAYILTEMSMYLYMLRQTAEVTEAVLGYSHTSLRQLQVVLRLPGHGELTL